MDELTKIVLDSLPEVSTPITVVASGGGGRTGAVNNGSLNLYLVPPDQRERTQQQIYNEIAKEVSSVTGITATPSQPPTIGARFGGQPVQFVIQSQNFDSVAAILTKVLDEARKEPALRFVDANLKVNKPEINLTVDRIKAADLGISFLDIAQTLQISLGGTRFGYSITGGQHSHILGQVDRKNRNNPYDLRNLFVRSRSGDLVQLDNLVKLKEQATPTTRYRYNRFSSATITAGLTQGYTLGDGINAMNRVAAKILPQDFNTALAGQSKDFAESSSSLIFTFL